MIFFKSQLNWGLLTPDFVNLANIPLLFEDLLLWLIFQKDHVRSGKMTDVGLIYHIQTARDETVSQNGKAYLINEIQSGAID